MLGDGGYLIELERRGYVSSGSKREKVGTGRGSGQPRPKWRSSIPTRSANCTSNFCAPGRRFCRRLPSSARARN